MGIFNLPKRAVDHKYFDIVLRGQNAIYVGYRDTDTDVIFEFSDDPTQAQIDQITLDYNNFY